MKNLINRMDLIEEVLSEEIKSGDKKYLLSEMKRIGIEKLPYSYSSLKSFIDPETMDVHYNKHYKGYVEKLNLALNKRKLGDLELEDIIRTISRYSESVRNNAGGAFNHALFWKMLSPKPIKISNKLSDVIDKNFGSFREFKKEFESKSKERFGSGWVWLVLTKNNKLKIMTTPNQDNPLMNIIESGGYPILGLDLWEHAYYLKYKNRRDVYIKNFWKVVNWDFVEKLYDMKQDTKKEEEKIIKEIFERD
jgi:superoxide dismutase, Fe-Mn family